MKLFLTSWVLLLIAHTALYAQTQFNYTHTISERVGKTMNPQQRNYFLLFPDIENFREATFSAPYADGSIDVIIRRGVAETTLSLPQQTARDLAFYIDNFERIYLPDTSYNVYCDLSQIRHLLRPMQRYRFYPKADVASLRLLDGSYREGEIIAATDSVLILWPAGTPYEWQKAASLARIINFSEIAVLDIGKEIIVRGDKSIFDNITSHIHNDLAFYSIQSENLPPELNTLLNEKRPISNVNTDESNGQASVIPGSPQPERIAVKLYQTFPVDQYSKYIHRRYIKNVGADQPSDKRDVLFNALLRSSISSIKVTYALSPGWRLGGLFSYSSAPAASARFSNYLAMQAVSVGVSIDRAVSSYNPVSPSFWGNVESDISLSIQNHFATLFVASKSFYEAYERVRLSDVKDEQTDNLISVELTATIGYRIVNFLNIYIGGSTALFPALNVQESKKTFYRFGRGYEYGWQGGTSIYLEHSLLIGTSLFL